MGSVIGVFKNYTVFSGRSGREEYWKFVLFATIIYLVLAVIAVFAGVADLGLNSVSALFGLYFLFVVIAGLSVSVRRLHDTGRNWKLLLINLVPVFGNVMFVFFMGSRGDWGENPYGIPPGASVGAGAVVVTAEEVDALARNAEGVRLHQAGDHDGAIKALTEGIDLDPVHANIYRNRAEAYRATNKTAEADADDAKADELGERVTGAEGRPEDSLVT